jgi:hypothetical protein
MARTPRFQRDTEVDSRLLASDSETYHFLRRGQVARSGVLLKDLQCRCK